MADPISQVLVCDDERFFREAIRDILVAEGFGVLEAEDGEAALVCAGDPSVGVLVLDVRLPGIGGLEVLRRLGETRPDLRVIMLSASNDQELVLEALRLGAFDYLAKPLHDEELVLAVKRAAQSHELVTDWGRLRARVERLATQLEAVAQTAEEADPAERVVSLAESLVVVVADVLEATRTSLLLASEDDGALEIAASHGRRFDSEELEPVPFGHGVAGVAFEAGEPLTVADIEVDERFVTSAQRDRYESKSFSIAPLVFGGEPMGLLCAADRAGGGAFSEEDLSLLRLVASHAARLLRPVDGEATPLEDDAGTSSDPVDSDAELARVVCEAIRDEIEPDRLFAAALEPVADMLRAAPVSIHLVDETGELLRCQASCDGGAREDRSTLPVDAGLTGVVARTGRLVATDAPADDDRFAPEVDSPADGRTGPLVCAPLSLRGNVVGVLRIFPHEWSPGLGRSAEVLSAALSAAVRNVLLYRSLLDSIDEVAAARRMARR
jgi:DNA-binding response OmpR family regulator